MTGSDETDQVPTPPQPADVIREGAEIATDAAETVSATAQSLGEAMASTTRQTADAMAAASAAAATETSKAFEEARTRLHMPGLPGFGSAQDFAGRFKEGADAFTSQMAGGFGPAAEAMSAFNAKAVEAWRTNAEATLAHWQKLATVTSWSDAIALNTAHARKQIEVITTQTRELAELAGQIARDGAQRWTPKS